MNAYRIDGRDIWCAPSVRAAKAAFRRESGYWPRDATELSEADRREPVVYLDGTHFGMTVGEYIEQYGTATGLLLQDPS